MHSFIHIYILSFNKYLFTVCQALCRTLANKDKIHVLLTVSSREMSYCTTLILRCIILIMYLKSEYVLLSMILII